jgi:hypothetical protein
MDVDQELYFQFCQVGGLVITTRGLIWLEVGQESMKFSESHFVLATFMNSASNCGNF